jgi:hypothetical protein
MKSDELNGNSVCRQEGRRQYRLTSTETETETEDLRQAMQCPTVIARGLKAAGSGGVRGAVSTVVVIVFPSPSFFDILSPRTYGPRRGPRRRGGHFFCNGCERGGWTRK